MPSRPLKPRPWKQFLVNSPLNTNKLAGQKVSSELEVNEQKITLRMKLGLILRIFIGDIRMFFNESLEELFE